MQNGIPTIISKQSGVAEVSESLVKIDFWDTDAMQKAVIQLLHSPAAAKKLSTASKKDITQLSWKKSAENVHSIYHDMIGPLNASTTSLRHA